MRLSLLDYLFCPDCHSRELSVKAEISDEHEIREGSVSCSACGRTYPINKGILDVLYEPNAVVLQEREAVHRLDAPRQEWQVDPDRDEFEHRALLSLPYGLDHPQFHQEGSYWWNVSALGPCFDEMLRMLRLRPGSHILEVGADNCWAMYRLSQQGHRCVALDITNHLGTGDHYIHDAGVYFDRIQADMNNLPFRDSAFDLVLAVAAVHHTGDLPATFAGCARVLRRGGRIAFFNEPLRDHAPSADFVFGEAERELGINERHYWLEEWLAAARHAGLVGVAAHPLISDTLVYLSQHPSLKASIGRLGLGRMGWINSWLAFDLQRKQTQKWAIRLPSVRTCIIGTRPD